MVLFTVSTEVPAELNCVVANEYIAVLFDDEGTTLARAPLVTLAEKASNILTMQLSRYASEETPNGNAELRYASCDLD